MRSWKLLLPLLASTVCFAAVQPDRITGTIDSGQTVALPGRIHRKALPQYDQGRIEAGFQMGSVTMLFAPSASQSQALDLLLAQQQDPKSPNYHKWLTPEQFGARFGLGANDIRKVTDWLKAQNLRIVTVARGGQFIVFTGTAAQIENAFQTEIHRYNVEGESHFANAIVPSIPAALVGIVAGFRGLNDFTPKPAIKPHPQYTVPDSSTHYLAPGDLSTIYDLNSLYALGIDGTGQQIVLVGQSDIFIDDINYYRTAFGLSSVSSCTAPPSCNTPNLVYIQATAAPGYVAGDISESDLDLEVSSATAPNAQLIFVTSNAASGGVNYSAQYAIDNDVAPVISMSYGECEFDAAGPEPPTLSTQDLIYKQAAGQGISFFAASGDDGPAICDLFDTTQPVTTATQGLSVSYPASSAYITAVGGTEFTSDSGAYWNTSNNSNGNGGSAKSYIPERSWNDFAVLGYLDGGGGGPSNCFNQTSNFAECVSGNSPKPTWQAGIGVPNDGVRDVPDVSLSASNVYDPYIVCTPESEIQGAPDTSTSTCANGIPSAIEMNSAFGGTSASTPLMAGITVLLNQYLAGNSPEGLGLINPMLYSLASNPATYASAFNDTPAGSNSTVNCTAGTPSDQPVTLQCPSGGTFGFDTTTGYDRVTGLGSVNAFALAQAWAATRANTTTTISPPSTTSTPVYQGNSVTFTATVSPSSATGTVSFYNNGSTTALGSANVSSGTATFATTALPAGADSVVATYNGNSTLNSSTSVTPSTLTVIAPYTISASPSTLSVPAGQTATSTITITPVGSFTGTVNFNSTTSPPGGCTSGVPAGAVCSFSQGGSVSLSNSSPQTITLTITTAANMALPAGPQTITITSTSGNAAIPTTVSLTVTATNQAFTFAPNAATYTVAVGGTVPINLTVSGTGSPISFVGSNATVLPLTYTCSGSPSLSTAEIACQFSPTNGQATNATSVTLNLVTTAPTAQLRSPLERGSRIFYALLLPGLFGIVFAAGSRARGLRLLSLIVVLGFSTLWLGSCSGGGGGGGTTTPPNQGTPTGSYTVTINATTQGTNPVTFALTGIPLNVSAQ
jgi:hypothetical protein